MHGSPYGALKACRTRSILDDAKAVQIYRYKLDNNLVTKKEIKRAARVLSKHFSVAEKTIRDIWRGRTWRFETEHLDPERKMKLALPRLPGRPRKEEPSAGAYCTIASLPATSTQPASTQVEYESVTCSDSRYDCQNNVKFSFASVLQGGTPPQPSDAVEVTVGLEAFRCMPALTFNSNGRRGNVQENRRHWSLGLLLNYESPPLNAKSPLTEPIPLHHDCDFQKLDTPSIAGPIPSIWSTSPACPSDLPPLSCYSSLFAPQSLPTLSSLQLGGCHLPLEDPLALGALALMQARCAATEAIVNAQSQPPARPDPALRSALLRVLACNRSVLGHL